MAQTSKQRWMDLKEFLEVRDLDGSDLGLYDEESLAEENLTVVGIDDLFSEP